MSESTLINRRIVLNSRPIGAPVPDNFRLESLPAPALAAGEVLIRTRYLSLDPYMRGRMSDSASYAAAVGIGEVMVGAVVARVEATQHSDFQIGDLALGYTGWQELAVAKAATLTKLDAGLSKPSLALGVLGMPGFTAYMGLLDIGQPKTGETVVVAAASGAVGSMVGQIAKLKGCRVVGIAGGAEKCRYVVEELGFDACIDHRASDFPKQLADACTQGIDVYFENVGGAVFDAVLPLLNTGARVPVCGVIANYNDTALPDGPDRMGLLVRTLLTKRIKMQGFIIFDDYGHRYGEFFTQMSEWLAKSQIKFREDIVIGLETPRKLSLACLKERTSAS